MRQCSPPWHYRTIWISDVHLGSRGCQSNLLLDFLQHTTCERLYLVGDIIDVWAMQKKIYWPASHTQIVQSILAKAQHGTTVIYLPGNHDAVLRDYIGMNIGPVAIRDQVIHTTADGRRLLVVHGDQLEYTMQQHRWLAAVGAWLYDALLTMTQQLNWLRRACGLHYWSLAAVLKRRVKYAMQYVTRYTHAGIHSAQQWAVDGVLCGHIHHADLQTIHQTVYANCGDWVENCTAIVESHDGQLAILDWLAVQQARETHWYTPPLLTPVAHSSGAA